jgi:CxxC motif-containing protein (DUF1111 family)
MIFSMKYIFILMILALALLAACKKVAPKAPENAELLDGPVDGLTGEQRQRFLRGDIAFNKEVFTSETGLGSVFVATSCGSCHAGDGKGHPFTTLTRFGQTDSSGNRFLDQGGPQLQNRAVPGYLPEQIPAGASFSKFTPPANTGLGFIELVSDADLLAMSDPGDADGDGISGVPNWSPLASYLTPFNGAMIQGGKYIHRFGKKAGAYNLLNQTANAYNQDMGITSAYSPKDVYSHLEIDPEIATSKVNDVVFYLQTLKAPVQRDQSAGDVVAGKELFIRIGCEKCHKQTLRSGYSPVEPLSNKAFHPYTDLLLHDMGAGLDDGYTEGNAKTYEWRTPPLWGLGLSKNSQGGQYFLLHDGRASTLEQAISLHGGESQNSNSAFQSLSSGEKQQLITFLESL